MPGCANADRKNHIPDELQVDLGNSDAGCTAVACDREGHERLGSAMVGDRTVPDAC